MNPGVYILTNSWPKRSGKKSAFEKGNKIMDEKGRKIKIRRAREKEGKRERKNCEKSKKNLLICIK